MIIPQFFIQIEYAVFIFPQTPNEVITKDFIYASLFVIILTIFFNDQPYVIIHNLA